MLAITVDAAKAADFLTARINMLQLPFDTDRKGYVLVCASGGSQDEGTIPGKALCYAELTGCDPYGDGFLWKFRSLYWIEPFDAADAAAPFEVDDDLIRIIPGFIEPIDAFNEFYRPAFVGDDTHWQRLLEVFTLEDEDEDPGFW
ncbi:hypothetical protein [Slackia heliotrinireducens]|uniref:hypothetical protein n=1 Tax=Slackia heliotrinireducens TaxID=84110 RepID=UPI0033152D59